MNTQEITQIANSLESISVEEISTQYLLQSAAWARVKMAFGWTPFAFRQHCFPDLATDILVLVRKLPMIPSLAYIPDGILYASLQKDIVDFEDASAIKTLQLHVMDACVLIAALHKALEKQGCRVLFVRWDVPWLCQKTLQQDIEQSQEFTTLFDLMRKINIPCVRVRMCETIQPPATVMIDLRNSKDDLLRDMKQKTRYNIRLADKKGVVIDTGLGLEEFYELYKTTSLRNRIAVHSQAYYKKVVDEISQSKESDIFIYGARFEGTLIAAIVVVHTLHSANEKTAVYLYGASSDEYRNMMPAYALQWKAISDAKEAGCTYYDMFGIPLIDDSSHRMYGMYKFKIGFGGKIRFRLACFEIFLNIGPKKILRRLSYGSFLLVEKMRLWYHYNYKK